MDARLCRCCELCSWPQESERTNLLEQLGAETIGDLHQHPAILRGVASAETTARQLIDRAIRELQQLPDSPEKNLLTAIAQFSVGRSA